MNLYDQTIPAYRQMLKSASGMLDKAVSHGCNDSVMEAKLAEDMHSLAVQIRFVSNMPGEAMQRLTGKPYVSSDGDDATIAAAKARLAAADKYLAAISPDQFVADDSATVLDLPNGMQFTMTAEQYVRDWALPQFYFHLTTAYAILRHKGVPLGKADYVPYIVRYMTGGSMG